MIGFQAIYNDLTGVPNALFHLGFELWVQAKHIVIDQQLSVRIRTGTQRHDNAVFGPFGDDFADAIWNHFKHDGKCACFIEAGRSKRSVFIKDEYA